MTPADRKDRITQAYAGFMAKSRGERVPTKWGTEAQETERVIAWLEQRGIACFGVPNAGKRSYGAANALKAQGMRRGVPDIIIVTPPPVGGFGACAIEMKKVSGGDLRMEQYAWLTRMSANKWAAKACAGAHEAIAWLEELGYGRLQVAG
jgi:hypothetical protein